MAVVYGVGINDGLRPIRNCDGSLSKEYNMWRNMLARCYREGTKIKQESYKDCITSEEFKIYSVFYDWYQLNKINNEIDYHLDKDLLLKGNKKYTKDTCVLVPREINAFLTKREALRGDLPIGVHFHKPLNRFRAQIRKDKGSFHLGYFNTPEEAFLIYKEAKEAHAKELAERYSNDIDIRAYNALMSYIVDIND